MSEPRTPSATVAPAVVRRGPGYYIELPRFAVSTSGAETGITLTRDEAWALLDALRTELAKEHAGGAYRG